MSAVAEPAASAACPWPAAGGTYRPRRPQDTLLHRVVWEHFQTFLTHTWAEDVLCCPRCRGRMALIEVVTDQAEVRRTLDALGPAHQPVVIAPARDPDEPSSPDPRRRAGRGPPSPDPPDGAGGCSVDESGDPPWQDDGQLPLDDDAPRLPPGDAEF